jgi:hypothetical protein
MSLHIHSSINFKNVTFVSPVEVYKVSLSVVEAQFLTEMLLDCVSDPIYLVEDSELELLILAEVMAFLKNKVHGKFKASIKLSRSQARTVFMWLNERSFDHPLHQSLGYKIVAQIDKQISIDSKWYHRNER